jgi:hypothetical protein
MTKAQETRARRAAVLSLLGPGWKAMQGVESRDMYKNGPVIMFKQRTVDGNFYVGHCSKYGFCYTQTLEQAVDVAKKWIQ